jgi:hypothetical protein
LVLSVVGLLLSSFFSGITQSLNSRNSDHSKKATKKMPCWIKSLRAKKKISRQVKF